LGKEVFTVRNGESRAGAERSRAPPRPRLGWP
jgi:hypothetical protein